MAVEAHRLIAVSLGKLASSRSQRGGVRLHKSLLVAGVLISARSACIQARHRPSVSDQGHGHSQSDDEEDEDYENSDEEDYENSDEEENVSLSGSVNSSANASLFVDNDETSTHTIVGGASPESIRSDTRRDCDPISPKDNCKDILELVTVVASSVEDVASKRNCSKRPREDDDDEDLGGKKVRYELELGYLREPVSPESDRLPMLNACNSTDSATNTEPMDCLQMSSLVHSFSAGFSGLLRGVGEPCERYKTCVSYASDMHETEHRSATSESIISCSTQIREALETLSRPILAMTV